MMYKRSLLLLIGYGFGATLSVFYGLVEKQSLFVTFVCFHVVVCLCIPLLHGWWEGTLRQSWLLAWGKIERRGTIFGFMFGTLLFAGAITGFWLLLQTDGRADTIRRILESWDLNRRWIWWFSLYLVVLNSLLEELFWRGFVLQRFKSAISRPVAVILTSFFYSLYHLVVSTVLFGLKWGVLITLLVFLVGIVWGWMKGKFPSVYPTWFSHMLADLGLVVPILWWVF
ncbi:type II CAAX endopeptidase family protein [Brevibacillus choshinensis]|uniref:CPBP family intramembrane glutamic endopeptidase n=1 Tax=Brevibacillus choshinensis TaxID=54911 RepID=UPI002E20E7DC|nr:type II CAAX endopeptidase family protein [Brevibacillus choshinensis]MED4780518.1 type II CAAX endopeptidase family protein [Brevibacillus choshinensis]